MKDKKQYHVSYVNQNIYNCNLKISKNYYHKFSSSNVRLRTKHIHTKKPIEQVTNND